MPHVIASRTPRQGQLSLEEGLREALVVLAVPAHVVHSLPLDNLSKDSVVVDCSNRERKCGLDELSQAEQLAASLPPAGPVVVKALNTVSGYFLEQVSEQSVKPVPIASDSNSAKVTIWAHLFVSFYLCHGFLSSYYCVILSSYNQGHGWQPPHLSRSQPHGYGWACRCSQVEYPTTLTPFITYLQYLQY